MNVSRKNYMVRGGAVILLISLALAIHALAYDASDLQFGSVGVSQRLQPGDVINYNGYSIQAVMFPGPEEADRYKDVPVEPVDPYVGLNISKKGVFTNTTVLRLGESFISPDGEIKVTAKELPGRYAKEWVYEHYAPSATVEVSPRGRPQLEVSVDTDKTEYTSSNDPEIVAVVRVDNKGSADALKVNLDVRTGLSVKRGALKYSYERIPIGGSITETIAFASPIPTEETKYDILANVTAVDVKDLAYTDESSRTITIAVDPLWSMTLRKNVVDKMYLKEMAMVSLTLKNNGKYDVRNVTVEDSLSGGFRLVHNDSLSWTIPVIGPGKEWEKRYFIETEEPNSDGVELPAATATFKVKKEFYGLRSNQPKVVVYGPKVVLNKKTDVSEFNPDDTITVTVTAINKGSTLTRVFIRDQLPPEGSLVSGVTAFEETLLAGKEISFSYTLKLATDKPVKLPAAFAEYYKLGTKGGKISTSSQEIELRIKPPEPVSTPEPQPTPTFEISSVPAVEPAATPAPDTGSKAKEPAKNEIAVPQYPEVNTVLKIILGCDGQNSRNNSSVIACTFYRK